MLYEHHFDAIDIFSHIARIYFMVCLCSRPCPNRLEDCRVAESWRIVQI
jgi:hypothetical protein